MATHYNIMKSDSFKFGMTLSGAHPDKVAEALSFNKVASTSPELAKRAARLASGMFDAAGKSGSAHHLLFSKIAGSEWDPGYATFTDAVINVLGRHELEKTAKLNPLDIIRNSAAYSMGGLKTALLTSLVLGAGGGALYNWGKRSMNADTSNADATETRLQHYRKITREIENDMKRRGVSPEESSKSVMESYVNG